MGIFTKPDAGIDLTRSFVDSSGANGPLQGFLLGDRPFILVPIFYRCPRLCGLTVSGVVELVNHLTLELGRDYSVVMYSFNPDDTRRDAEEKRAKMVARINKKPLSSASVRFLTAKPEVISSTNDELGFRVRYADKELEHSSAIFVVTPDGGVVRHFAGVEFNPSKVAQALRDAEPRVEQ
jgi:protein SCO1/2